MAVHDMKVERQALDARARAILDECPDVYRLIPVRRKRQRGEGEGTNGDP
jgi:hypothetical protein